MYYTQDLGSAQASFQINFKPVSSIILQSIKKMVDRISKFKILNNEIFSILNRYLQGPRDQQPFAFAAELREVSPPSADLKFVAKNNNEDESLSEA